MNRKRSTNDRFVIANTWVITVFTVLLGFYLIYWLLNYSLKVSLILTAAFAAIGYLRIRLITIKILVTEIDNELTSVKTLSQGYEKRLKSLEEKVETLRKSEDSQK
jgi:hypothetical protein